jgi:hypothetical protein
MIATNPRESQDPRVHAIADVILDFPWWNYRLDEVSEIPREYADYAWHLAQAIVQSLEPEKSE